MPSTRWLVVLAAALLAGGLAVTAVGASDPRCFGAASRDPGKRCHNPKLDRTAVPSLDDVLLEPGAPCTVVRQARPNVCTFGVKTSSSRRRLALIGDSHSVHWRAALGAGSHRRRWHLYSLYQSKCPFNLAFALLAGAAKKDCAQWKPDVIEWMKTHRAIDTVLVSQHHVPVRPARGKSMQETEIDGYIAAWKALPTSVKRVIVIRDPPYNVDNWQDCVARALSRKQRPGITCRVPRYVSLHEDAAVLAARRLGSPRVKVVDLTSYFCGSRFCYPVVGGVLTHKDHGHLSREYSTTLGPYLGRALDALL
jgi:hypothetical protein